MLPKILNNCLSNDQQPNALFFGLFGVFYVVLLLTCISNGQMGNDEGIWSYMARVWIDHNHQLYVDAIDDKPSGILLLNALSYKLFGINFYFPRLMGGLAILGTSLILYKLNNLFFDSKPGIFALLIYPCTMLWQMVNGPIIAQTETFMVFFTTLAFYFWFGTPNKSNGLYLLIGICFGIAVSFKQVAGLSLIALLMIIGIHYQWSRKLFLNIILIGLAFLISFGLIQLPLVNSYSALQNFIHFAWLNPNHYPTLFWRIPNFLEMFWQSRLMLFYPFLIGAFWHYRKKQASPYSRGLFIWLLFTFIGTNLSGYYYGHQLTPMLPSMSLLAGISIAYLVGRAQFKLRTSIGVLILLFIPFQVMFTNLSKVLTSQESFKGSIKALVFGHSQPKAIGKVIQKATSEGDQVYYFGHRSNAILSYSNRKSASPYFNTIFINDKNTQKKVVEDLKTNDPDFIVKDRKTTNYAPILDYLKRHYVPYKNYNYWTLYQRK